MTEELVVDSNVLHVANGAAEQAAPRCVAACIGELERARTDCRVVFDSAGEILAEYRHAGPQAGQRQPADVFFKWVARNRENAGTVRQVTITPHEQRGFEEFPDDPQLDRFDHDDRKFVAVALASGTSPPIVNASDGGWWEHLRALQDHGLKILFPYPELMPQR